MPAQAKRGFEIAVSCPACGGELELNSDFLVTMCSHCSSVLRISLPGTPPAYLIMSKLTSREVRFKVDRYLKSNGMPLTGFETQTRGFYYPYWKVDGVLLRLRNRIETRQSYDEDFDTEASVQQRKVETTLSPYTVTLSASSPLEGIPPSIGERADYIKIIPFCEENAQDGFAVVPLSLSWGDALQQVAKNVANLSQLDAPEFGANRSELFRPICSLIYFPYYLFQSTSDGNPANAIVDGVTGRVLSMVTNESPLKNVLDAQTALQEFEKLGVELHRCGNCGEGLPDSKSYVYICHNCHSLTVLENYPSLRREICAATVDKAHGDRLFPFWSIKVSERDAIIVKRLFGGLTGSDRLVIPAFRIPSFEAMYRLCKRMSPAISKFGFSPINSFDQRYLPVNVGVAEALVLAEAILLREQMGRELHLIDQTREFASDDISLVFAPFHPESYFYVDSALGAVTFERTLVDRSG
jgi:predicted RNA-binding Zn-ribbon protein involved in translation (DUF1610 family)